MRRFNLYSVFLWPRTGDFLKEIVMVESEQENCETQLRSSPLPADCAWWLLSRKIDLEIKWRQIVIKFTALFTTALSLFVSYFEQISDLQSIGKKSYFAFLFIPAPSSSISLMHWCTLKIHIFFTTKREKWYLVRSKNWPIRLTTFCMDTQEINCIKLRLLKG